MIELTLINGQSAEISEGMEATKHLLRGEDIYFRGGSENFIPFKSTELGVITREIVPAEPKEDTLCVSEGGGGGNPCIGLTVTVPPPDATWFGERIGDFQENVTVSGDTISGTIKCKEQPYPGNRLILDISWPHETYYDETLYYVNGGMIGWFTDGDAGDYRDAIEVTPGMESLTIGLGYWPDDPDDLPPGHTIGPDEEVLMCIAKEFKLNLTIETC